MPIALPAITGTVASNLLAAALIGTETPKLAAGVAAGLTYWVPQVTVSTVDAGSAGVGSGVPIPWAVPQPLLFGLLGANIPSAGIIGLFTPSLVLGLANGLATSFLQMLISTTHPTVGVGSGVAKFVAPPAAGSMVAGFSSAGLVGEAAPRLATAIGFSLDAAIASLVIPIVIAGSASPSPSTGTGTGKII
jgi:hypothetical protein